MTNLREKMKQEMILRGLSLGTQALYLRAVIKLDDHYGRSPAQLTEAEIKTFLLQVISSQSYAESSYNIMIHSLKFFYEHVLHKKVVPINLPRHKEPQKLPDILSRNQVTQIINVTKNIMHRALLVLIYGAGLRASEAASMTVRDIDSARSVIHIRNGKGKKDRYVTLSPTTLNTLRDYWRRCRLTSSRSNLAGHNNPILFVNQSGRPLSGSSVAAISNERIISCKDGKVTFKWRDYSDNNKSKIMTLDAVEFIRRYLKHVLPNKFMRVRSYGILANACKTKNIELIRNQLTPNEKKAEVSNGV